MEKYLNKLIEQFKSATGTKKVDVNSQEFVKEFSEWVKSRKLMGKDYTSFIEYMAVHPTVISKESIEIGKGKHDSIALDTGIHMITPYSEGIKRTNAGIITANFFVYDGIPAIIRYNKGGNQIEAIDPQYVRSFLTHNPYEQSCIRNWEQLHNIGGIITVGIFGSLHDKDIESKIRQLEMLKDKMNSGYKDDYATIDDSYFYAITSTRKVLVKTKTYTKTR